ncbi:hypothetical protein VZT92_024648 [Zoarces viviparus]|uniref:Cilia- and flagella-associated protein 161 n=1 Tax=Zoarces viviparus TaxID=48416 RepID=A0AAW1E2T4_ZOAVI
MTPSRSYSYKVKTGNWFEDVLCEEAKRDPKKEERGELVAQKVDFLKQNMLRPVNLTVTDDGRLHFGNVVMLVNMAGETRACSAVSINADMDSVRRSPSPGIQAPCEVSAGKGIQGCVRTAFIITSVDGSPEGSTLHYQQRFALQTTSGFAGGLYLTSDTKSFAKCAKKSRLQEVSLDDGGSFTSWWKIVHFQPQERPEYEGQPVPANVRVLIKHCKTNQALAVLEQHVIWTPYGNEYELTAHTFLNSCRGERDNNHWILCTSDSAGKGLVILNNPQSAAHDEELAQANPDI